MNKGMLELGSMARVPLQLTVVPIAVAAMTHADRTLLRKLLKSFTFWQLIHIFV